MAEIIDLGNLELPDCESCRDPSKRILGRTMDLEGPGVPGVLYRCDNRKCRSRYNAIGSFLFMGGDVGIVKRRKTRARAVAAVAPSGERTVYPSVSDAAFQTGGQVSRISYACRTGTLYRGIAWEYADGKDNQ